MRPVSNTQNQSRLVTIDEAKDIAPDSECGGHIVRIWDCIIQKRTDGMSREERPMRRCPSFS